VTQYATNGLPLRVVLNYTYNYDGFGARLASGCRGDGTNAIDLVLNVNGDGLTYGPQHDAVRVMNSLPGASNLEITGHANCGRRVNTSYHQDGIQVLGGTNVTWIDFQVGNYDAGRSTCQGAGGSFFYSLESVNTRVVGGKYIACNASLAVYPGVGGGSVSGASFRSGRNDGTDPACNYHSSPPCDFGTTVTRGPNVTCQRWNPTADRWDNQ
jgi:predicted nucleic-acid-binding Zn-ribbon protein